MAKGKNDNGLMDRFACCMSTCGMVHIVAGIGVGFLLVNYLGLTEVMFWGWLLVIASVVGHFFWKMH
jgi:hypothetical protein